MWRSRERTATCPWRFPSGSAGRSRPRRSRFPASRDRRTGPEGPAVSNSSAIRSVYPCPARDSPPSRNVAVVCHRGCSSTTSARYSGGAAISHSPNRRVTRRISLLLRRQRVVVQLEPGDELIVVDFHLAPALLVALDLVLALRVPGRHQPPLDVRRHPRRAISSRRTTPRRRPAAAPAGAVRSTRSRRRSRRRARPRPTMPRYSAPLFPLDAMEGLADHHRPAADRLVVCQARQSTARRSWRR